MLQKPPFTKRIAALFIDYLYILTYMVFLAVVNFVLFGFVLQSYPDYLGLLGPVGSQLLFFTVLTFPVGLYLYFTESSSTHATFGKQRLHLRVNNKVGGKPTKKQIALRTIVKLLPWEIAHIFVWQLQYVFYTFGYDATPPVWIWTGMNISTVLAIVYVAMVAFRKDGRGPHDLVAGTRVGSIINK